MGNISEHFDLEEFVDEVTFKELGMKSIEVIDEKIKDIAEYIRVTTGRVVYINTWNNNGQYHESGTRRPESTTGAKYSKHKYFRDKNGKIINPCQAIDVKIVGLTSKLVQQFIIAHKKELYALGLRRIEDCSITKSWNHLDTSNHGIKDKVLIINRTSVIGRF